MLPKLDRVSATIAFIAVIAVGVGGLFLLPVGMATETILTMVFPSMVVFGAIMFLLGASYGSHRANA